MPIIPIIIREIELPYFPKSDYERQKELEERKRIEHEKQKMMERKAFKKRETIRLKKLRQINKEVKKNGFTVANFRGLYDHSQKQELSGDKLEKIKKIYKKMRKYSIYTFDLEIYEQEEKIIEKKESIDSDSARYDSQTIEVLQLSFNNGLLNDLCALRENIVNASNKQEQKRLVKKR